MLQPIVRRAAAYSNITTKMEAREGKPARRSGKGSHGVDRDPRRTLKMEAQDGKTAKRSGKRSHAAEGGPHRTHICGTYMARRAGGSKAGTTLAGKEGGT